MRTASGHTGELEVCEKFSYLADVPFLGAEPTLNSIQQNHYKDARAIPHPLPDSAHFWGATLSLAAEPSLAQFIIPSKSNEYGLESTPREKRHKDKSRKGNITRKKEKTSSSTNLQRGDYERNTGSDPDVLAMRRRAGVTGRQQPPSTETTRCVTSVIHLILPTPSYR